MLTTPRATAKPVTLSQPSVSLSSKRNPLDNKATAVATCPDLPDKVVSTERSPTRTRLRHLHPLPSPVNSTRNHPGANKKSRQNPPRFTNKSACSNPRTRSASLRRRSKLAHTDINQRVERPSLSNSLATRRTVQLLTKSSNN